MNSTKKFVFILSDKTVELDGETLYIGKESCKINNINSVISYRTLSEDILEVFVERDIPFIVSNKSTNIIKTNLDQIYRKKIKKYAQPLKNFPEYFIISLEDVFFPLLKKLFLYGNDYFLLKEQSKMSWGKKKGYRADDLDLYSFEGSFGFIKIVSPMVYRVMLFTLLGVYAPSLFDGLEDLTPYYLRFHEDPIWEEYNRGIPDEISKFFFIPLSMLAVDYYNIHIDFKQISPNKVPFNDNLIRFLTHFTIDRINIIRKVSGPIIHSINMFKYGQIAGVYE